MIPIAGMTCFCWQDIYADRKEKESRDSRTQRHTDINVHVLFTVPLFIPCGCVSGRGDFCLHSIVNQETHTNQVVELQRSEPKTFVTMEQRRGNRVANECRQCGRQQ